jgi:outer membrane lipoprotein-sorting protein
MIIFLSSNSCVLFKANPKIDLANISSEEILRRVQENNSRIHTLSGRGHLIIEIPETPFRGEVTIRVIRPDSLYIVTEAAFGIDVGFLFADGAQFYSYSPIDNVYLIGEADQIGSLVLFNMKIAYKELLNSILGAASFPLQQDTQVELQDGKLIFSQRFRDQDLVYEVDPKRNVITKIQLFDPDGAESFRQEFRRFRKIDGIWVPQYIRLTRPQLQERLTVYYTKVELNVRLKASQFYYKVPENARREHLSR